MIFWVLPQKFWFSQQDWVAPPHGFVNPPETRNVMVMWIICMYVCMLCYVMLCYVMLCYVMLCYVMYVCMYVCMYVYIYTYACTYIYIYMYDMYARMYYVEKAICNMSERRQQLWMHDWWIIRPSWSSRNPMISEAAAYRDPIAGCVAYLRFERLDLRRTTK